MSPPATTTEPVAARPRWWRRPWVRWPLWAALVYGGVLAVLLLLETRLVFYPTSASDWVPPPPGLHVEDVELRTADGTPIHAWWCPPAGWEPSHGAVLYCHGNAGNLSYRGDALLPWQEHLGQAVLIFDYPGYGKSGGKPSEAGCYAAAEAAYAWLTERVPAERVLLYGKSLGGGVATELAVRHPCRGLVLVKTFTSIPDMAQKLYPFLPARWLVRNRFDNLAKIGSVGRPVFIAQADCDRLIPYGHGQRLFEAAGEPKRFYCLQGCDHNDWLCDEFYTSVRDFLAEVEAASPRQAARAN